MKSDSSHNSRLETNEQSGMGDTVLQKNPLVSIVTVVLNDEMGISKTIESVLQQKYEPIEYIVIDGGSTDGTLDKVRSYADKIDFWVSEQDQGISEAFNKGIRAAHGNFIGLINAGDWYEPDAVEQIVKTFSVHPETGVVCGALQFWSGEEKEYACQSEPNLLEKDMTVTHPTCFVRADLYEQHGLFDESYRYAMDYKLLLGLKVQSVPFISLRSVLTNMQHAGSSESNWKDALKETHRARMELLPGAFVATKWYYLFIKTKRNIRLFMQKFGWEQPIAFYRSRMALVKKNKA